MTVKIKHNKAHVLYKALEYEDCSDQSSKVETGGEKIIAIDEKFIYWFALPKWCD